MQNMNNRATEMPRNNTHIVYLMDFLLYPSESMKTKIFTERSEIRFKKQHLISTPAFLKKVLLNENNEIK